jgi:mannose-1-phosphate guanylyltransferase
LIDYWLSNLAGLGIERFLVNLHYRSEMVREHIESGPFSGQVEFVFEPSLLGTGGTLLANRKFVEAGTCLVVHADNLCQCDFGAFVAAHRDRPHGTELTLMTFRAPDPRSCGIVELDSRGVVQAFHEKVPDPPGDLASAAVFIIEPAILRDLDNVGRTVVDLSREVVAGMRGRAFAWHNTDYHLDLGTLQAWLAAQLDFPGDGHRVPPSGSWAARWEAGTSAAAARVVSALQSGWRADAVIGIDGRGGRARTLVVAPHFDEALASRLQERFVPETTLFLYWRVPASFSAARLHREFGLHSIGFCAE